MSRQLDPFEVGQRFRVVPPGTRASVESRIELILAPGAFGSGEHETTASCLELIERMPQVRGARVLDLGSGTGILAIAALKMGARFATCVDNDPGAVRTGERNCALNHLRGSVEHLCGTLHELEVDCFDVVFANLHGDLLLGLE